MKLKPTRGAKKDDRPSAQMEDDEWSQMGDDDYFRQPEQRTTLSFKIPESLKESLQVVVRLWRIRAVVNAEAKWKGADKQKREEEIEKARTSVDLTYVCTLLLTRGVAGAWKEIAASAGVSSPPATDEEWDLLRRALEKGLKKAP